MAKDKKEKTEKSQIVAFKVDEDLANFLDKLPNKSEFIRRAILAQFNMTCPLCTGSGVVPSALSGPCPDGAGPACPVLRPACWTR